MTVASERETNKMIGSFAQSGGDEMIELLCILTAQSHSTCFQFLAKTKELLVLFFTLVAFLQTCKVLFVIVDDVLLQLLTNLEFVTLNIVEFFLKFHEIEGRAETLT